MAYINLESTMFYGFAQKLKHLLTPQKDGQNMYKIQSFTYFIPSPPPRSTGYREKQFDKLFYEFINRGFKILNFSTQSTVTGEKSSGMWVIFILQATNLEASKLNLDDEFFLEIKDKEQVKNEIEGLYYIDDKANEL